MLINLMLQLFIVLCYLQNLLQNSHLNSELMKSVLREIEHIGCSSLYQVPYCVNIRFD